MLQAREQKSGRSSPFAKMQVAASSGSGVEFDYFSPLEESCWKFIKGTSPPSYFSLLSTLRWFPASPHCNKPKALVMIKCWDSTKHVDFLSPHSVHVAASSCFYTFFNKDSWSAAVWTVYHTPPHFRFSAAILFACVIRSQQSFVLLQPSPDDVQWRNAPEAFWDGWCAPPQKKKKLLKRIYSES